jgi:hypothetical protein
MAEVKARLTLKKIRLVLLTRSYANYRISQEIKRKYKLNNKLTSRELKIKYFKKRAIPEIARLSRVLNIAYKPLWESLILGKVPALNKKIPDREKIKAYVAIETELITLSATKSSKSSSFFDPDYADESAILSIAIERAVGNKLIDIDNDSVFNHQQEILQKLYLRWYYKVAWKYKLPTTRIIPFVLRLIGP